MSLKNCGTMYCLALFDSLRKRCAAFLSKGLDLVDPGTLEHNNNKPKYQSKTHAGAGN